MTSYSSITKAFKRDDAKKDVTIEDAEKAVETLITWIGDDPNREGLLETHLKELLKHSESILLVIKKIHQKSFLRHLKKFKVMMILLF